MKAKKEKIKMISDRILVKQIEEPDKTSGGIFIPDTAKERTLRGEVICVGPGKRDDRGRVKEIGVKPGDLVCFGKHGGVPVKLNDESYLVIKSGDLFGICEN